MYKCIECNNLQVYRSRSVFLCHRVYVAGATHYGPQGVGNQGTCLLMELRMRAHTHTRRRHRFDSETSVTAAATTSVSCWISLHDAHEPPATIYLRMWSVCVWPRSDEWTLCRRAGSSHEHNYSYSFVPICRSQKVIIATKRYHAISLN